MKISKRFYHNGSPRVPMIDDVFSSVSSSYRHGFEAEVTLTIQRPTQDSKIANLHETEQVCLEMTVEEAMNLANRLIIGAKSARHLKQQATEHDSMRKMRGFNPRWIIGRTIVDVKTHPFDDCRGGTAHKPEITLDNGATIEFLTEETDTGDYGTDIIYLRAKS